MRFNYVLGAALDSGLAVGALIVFFAVQMPKGGIELNWWGNTVWQNTADAMGLPGIMLAPNQTFGPTVVSTPTDREKFRLTARISQGQFH